MKVIFLEMWHAFFEKQEFLNEFLQFCTLLIYKQKRNKFGLKNNGFQGSFTSFWSNSF